VKEQATIKFEVLWRTRLAYVFFFCVGLLIFVVTVRSIFLQLGGDGYYLVAPVLLVASLALMIFTGSFIKKVWGYQVEVNADGTLVESGGSRNRVVKFRKFTGLRRAWIENPTWAIEFIISFMVRTHFESFATFVPSICGVGVDGGNQTFVPEGPLPIKKVILDMKAKFPDLVIDPAFSQDVNIWHHKQLFGRVNRWSLFWTIFFTLIIPIAPMVVYYILESVSYSI